MSPAIHALLFHSFCLWSSALEEQVDAVCPIGAELVPDAALRRAYEAQGLVLASSDGSKPAKSPHYLFVTGLAATGTTALHGLLGTSPEVGTLCGWGNANCEGRMLISPNWNKTKGDFDKREVKDNEGPNSVTEAIEIWNEYWNTSKPVLLQKSPHPMTALEKKGVTYRMMHEELTQLGKPVSFIVITRTPCFQAKHIHFGDRSDDPAYYPELRKLRQELQNDLKLMNTKGFEHLGSVLQDLRSAGARLLVVKYEELVADPYEVSRSILRFLPELKSLDPSLSGNSVNSKAAQSKRQDYTNKMRPINEYLSSRTFASRAISGISDLERTNKAISNLGYTKEWWTSSFIMYRRRSTEL
eukprot:TRINITY_DN8169_c0_g1_i6.p1 TRINITY_DN8169_c0_g1~~TRINITY_DN8169_c0_g1_i6.p1  ORF type:complete len:357 (-),score=51.02 TRINITY_DN8169_c0_g1_i6:23-1093(-)